MRCHILIFFFSVNVACYVYMWWWWVSWRVSFLFPSLNFYSTNTIIVSKSFWYLRFWWSKKKEIESQRLKVIMKHESIEHIMERIISYCAFFSSSSLQPLSIDRVVIDCSRWWDIIVITVKKSDQIMCVEIRCLFLFIVYHKEKRERQRQVLSQWFIFS